MCTSRSRSRIFPPTPIFWPWPPGSILLWPPLLYIDGRCLTIPFHVDDLSLWQPLLLPDYRRFMQRCFLIINVLKKIGFECGSLGLPHRRPFRLGRPVHLKIRYTNLHLTCELAFGIPSLHRTWPLPFVGHSYAIVGSFLSRIFPLDILYAPTHILHLSSANYRRV